VAVTWKAVAFGITSLLAILLRTPPAAASCPVDPGIALEGDSLAGFEPSTRLSFINDRMDVGAKRALAWSIGWGTAYGAAAVTQFALAPVVPERLRIGLYVGAIASTIGTLTRSINVPHVIRERRRLRRFLRSDPSDCLALREAERALVRSARWERRNTSLLLHFGALGFSVGMGLILSAGFKQPLAGHRQFAIGGAVGQAMIVTTPTVTLDGLRAYRRGALPTASLQTFPMLLPGGAGLAVGGSI
jgi:hypothetical protein